jgi:hypothetical protein
MNEEVTMSNESTADQATSKAIALPSSVEGFLALRSKPPATTLHDQVEQLYLSLYESEKFRQLRAAVYREQAVEGDLRDDDARSAIMIRDEAIRVKNAMVANEKLAVIRRSINVVEGRYHATRNQRRGAPDSK